jgi:beta-galactosidase/beta-glucuronidase
MIAAALAGSEASPSLLASIPLPAETDHVISLDGIWRFKLEQAPKPPRFLSQLGKPIPIQYPATIEPFYKEDYQEGADWHDIAVPSNWEIIGFSPATYNQPDNASGLYRLQFYVPAQWKGRLVKVNFDGVQNGCETWCNGQPVVVDEPSWGRTNYHESGWTAWQADVTSQVRFGETNLLALRVTKNTKSVNCDTGDYFFLGGVYRTVTLFSVPQTHFSDLTIRTTLQPEDSAEVAVIVRVSGATKGAKVSARLEGQAPVEGETDAKGEARLTQHVSHPRLWSAEFPNLYALSVELKSADDGPSERLSRNVGIREVSIRKGVFCVNNVPVKLVGICRHDVYPTLGSAVNEEVWRKDLTLMKAANFNAVRTSHYPYGSGFYDLCDQLGFYVLGEEPFCWVDTSDTNLTAAFAQRAREAVQRDKNHPCVVLWGIGNENKPGINNDLAAQITRDIDPTRPMLISCQKADQGKTPVEFDDKHYIRPAGMRTAEQDPRRGKWPMIYSENPNVWDVRNGPDYGSLDLWGAVIDRTWKELWNDDHVAGTFLWEWQDRAVADQCPTKYYYYYPKTGIQLVKPKGIVDGFRNPRPEYYHVKMAQAPIAVGDKVESAAEGVVLQVTNWYSFTDLSRLKLAWSLQRGAQALSDGSTRLSLPPRSHGPVKLGLPSEALSQADTLKLVLDHPGGWNVATYQVFLKPLTHPAPSVQAIKGVMFPRFNLVTGKQVRDEEGKGWRRLVRATGELVNIRVQKTAGAEAGMDEAGLLATPLMEVRLVDADVRLQPGSIAAGRVHAELAAGKFSYRFTWNRDKSDIYELGWIFQAPKGINRFSWSRKAVWSYYPPDHIGRPTGTAMPETALAELTKVDRPDAFDFNSTKFDCDWASLTDATGHGLCLEFSPGQRHHVRGGLTPDGGCTLIVNRGYSPPRDISSGIVAESYTVLSKDQQLEASFQIKEGAAP